MNPEKLDGLFRTSPQFKSEVESKQTIESLGKRIFKRNNPSPNNVLGVSLTKEETETQNQLLELFADIKQSLEDLALGKEGEVYSVPIKAVVKSNIKSLGIGSHTHAYEFKTKSEHEVVLSSPSNAVLLTWLFYELGFPKISLATMRWFKESGIFDIIVTKDKANKVRYFVILKSFLG